MSAGQGSNFNNMTSWSFVGRPAVSANWGNWTEYNGTYGSWYDSYPFSKSIDGAA
jgi:hypothetical protein